MIEDLLTLTRRAAQIGLYRAGIVMGTTCLIASYSDILNQDYTSAIDMGKISFVPLLSSYFCDKTMEEDDKTWMLKSYHEIIKNSELNWPLKDFQLNLEEKIRRYLQKNGKNKK